MPKLKEHERLFVYSMGKRFLVTGIYTSADDANRHCERNANDGVIAEVGGFVFVANIRSAPLDASAHER